MPIYVYETIPQKPGGKPKIYEITQSMSDEALTAHPETGELIQRVILGGLGVLSSASGKGGAWDVGAGCCGPGCCCK